MYNPNYLGTPLPLPPTSGIKDECHHTQLGGLVFVLLLLFRFFPVSYVQVFCLHVCMCTAFQGRIK